MSSGNIKAPGNGGSKAEWERRVSRRSYNPILYFSSEETGNAAGSIDVLGTYTLPIPPGGYFWRGNYQGLILRVWGALAPNANSKNIDVYFAGTLIFTYTAGLNEQLFRIETEIVRYAVDRIDTFTYFFVSNFGTGTHTIQRGYISSPGNRVGEGETLKFEGGGAWAADVRCRIFKVEQWSGPNAY